MGEKYVKRRVQRNVNGRSYPSVTPKVAFSQGEDWVQRETDNWKRFDLCLLFLKAKKCGSRMVRTPTSDVKKKRSEDPTCNGGHITYKKVKNYIRGGKKGKGCERGGRYGGALG